MIKALNRYTCFILGFLAGGILINLLFFFFSGWRPDAGAFEVFNSVIQSLIAGVAVLALVWPGYFSKLKERQELKNELEKSFKNTKKDLSFLVESDKRQTKRYLNKVENAIKNDSLPKCEGKIRSFICSNTVTINPSVDEAKALFDQADKQEVKINKALLVMYLAYDDIYIKMLNHFSAKWLEEEKEIPLDKLEVCSASRKDFLLTLKDYLELRQESNEQLLEYIKSKV